MTRRRKDGSFLGDLYEMLLIVPAWVGPPLALLFFLALRFLIPAIFGGSEKPNPGTVVVVVAKVFALPVAGLVLFTWLLAEVQKLRRRRLLDTQSGPTSIRDLSWREFEHLVGEAYRRQGYFAKETGSAAGDGGIDVLLTKGNERVLVQCKQWRTRRVGVKPVRELFGVMTSESATRGILVTCGSFTREARSFADGKPLDLVEGPELWELVQSVKATSPRSEAQSRSQHVESRSHAANQETHHADETAPNCPNCGKQMVRREAKKGPNVGSQFWGCSGFPNCRSTRECP